MNNNEAVELLNSTYPDQKWNALALNHGIQILGGLLSGGYVVPNPNKQSVIDAGAWLMQPLPKQSPHMN